MSSYLSVLLACILCFSIGWVSGCASAEHTHTERVEQRLMDLEADFQRLESLFKVYIIPQLERQRKGWNYGPRP